MILTALNFCRKGDKITNDFVVEALNEGLDWKIKQLKLLKDIQVKANLKKDTKLQIKLAEESLTKELEWQKKMMSMNIPYWFRTMSQDRIKEKEHLLNKLTLRNSFETGAKEGLSQESINNAKNYPIENLIDLDKRGFALKNPLREEKTSSFYCKNNFWHDFGNGETGDVIDLAIKIYKISFAEAINKLNKKL
jgi:asparagine synthetase B (glutamine-hydrolysing)